MSGDTPTSHYGMKLHNLECPDCSSDVFARETAHWTPDLAEHCAGCGSDLRVALDEDPEDPDVLTPRVFVYEHGGEVVARLLADIEQLKYEQDYTPPTGAVSEGLRACVKAAGQACLDGEADCPKEGCVVGHQAGEILDAYDDAAADVERLTEERDAIWAERVEEGKVAARAGREAALQRERAETAEQALAARLRDLCQVYGRNECGQRFPSKSAEDAAARRVAKRNGWDCYPEDSTTGAPSHTEKTDRPQQKRNGTDDEENEQPQVDPDLRASDQRPAAGRGARRRRDRDVDGDQHDGGNGDRAPHGGGPGAERATQARGPGDRAPGAKGGPRGDGPPRNPAQPVGDTGDPGGDQ